MNISRISFVAALLCFSCNLFESNKRVNSHVKDGVTDEKAIVAKVSLELNRLAEGIEQNNADKIFSIFSKDSAAVYVRDGEIAPSIDEEREIYARALADAKDKRGFSFERTDFDILSSELVLFTGLGVITSKGEEPWKITYTILFRLEETGWKALNMHISWANKT